MIAKGLISQMIDPLKTSDSGHYALSVMADFHIRHLPIVNRDQLLGIISEDDVLDHDPDEPVGSYQLSMNKPLVREQDHLFEVMSIMAEYNLTSLPVVDEDGNYCGLITLEDLLQYYAKSFSFTEPGSIIVLSLRKRDYSLSEISQIIESENAAILSTFISSDVDSENVFVTIKVNKQDISAILSAFERYEYNIKATFTEADWSDTLKERYDMLMSYLNV